MIATQAHQLRYGIFELPAIEFHYFLVGTIFLATFGPSIVVITCSEILLCSSISRYAKLSSVSIAILLLSVLPVWIYRFDVLDLTLDLACYPYPASYIAGNITSQNLTAVLLYIVLVLLKRAGFSKAVVDKLDFSVAVFLLSSLAFLFGRTIYSALPHALGGGAPVFAELRTQGNEIPGILITRNKAGAYLLRLESFPTDVSLRSPRTQYTLEPTTSVYKALAKNEVIFVASSKIDLLRVIGPDQTSRFEKYLD